MKIKNIILLSVCTAALLLVCMFTGTFAKYIRYAGEVVNKFNPAESVKPTVKEEFDHTVKENVYFEVGETEYPVYVRAKIVITWKKGVDTDGDGKIDDYIVAYELPKEAETIKGDDGSDQIVGHYQLELNETDWEFRSDGFYYYIGSDGKLKSVESGGKTEYLIKSCQQINDPPELFEDYVLSVEIIVQTVQAVGTTDADDIDAWKDAWESGVKEETNAEPQD